MITIVNSSVPKEMESNHFPFDGHGASFQGGMKKLDSSRSLSSAKLLHACCLTIIFPPTLVNLESLPAKIVLFFAKQIKYVLIAYKTSIFLLFWHF